MKCLYTLVRLPPDGAIQMPYWESNWGFVLHRGGTLPTSVPDYDSFTETLDALAREKQEHADDFDDFDEVFIAEFDSTKTLARLWFSEAQREAKLPDRLKRFKTCYGSYPISFYREREEAMAA